MMFQAPEEIVQELYQCTLPDAKCSEHVPGLTLFIITSIIIIVSVIATVLIAIVSIIVYCVSLLCDRCEAAWSLLSPV